MEISIIIPAYNEEKYIEKTLHSIAQQRYRNYEVIIVMNGCTDGTEKTVEHFKNNIKKKNIKNKIKYFFLPHAHVSKARNYGAEEAQGEVLVFLDADTQLSPDSLRKISEQFTEDYSVATTKVLPDINSFKFRLAMRIKNGYNTTKLYEGCSGILICWKKDFQKVGGYNPALTVREHRTLIRQLKKLGKYQCLNTHVITSMRRHQQWGLVKSTWFWMKQGMKEKVSSVERSKYEKVR